MPTQKLYPRLMPSRGRQLAQVLCQVSLEEAQEQSYLSERMVTWGATGAECASEDELGLLRERIRDVAQAHGYDYNIKRQEVNAQLAVAESGQTYHEQVGNSPLANPTHFDYDLAVSLHRSMALTPTEASEGGIWSFIACIMAPEIVRWRFPGSKGETPRARFLQNMKRNTFARCWWRAELLKLPNLSEPYALLHMLGEDELVQITERPYSTGYQALPVTMAAAFLLVYSSGVKASRSQLMRDVMKRLSRALSFIAFEALGDLAIVDSVLQLYAESVHSLCQEELNIEALRQPLWSVVTGKETLTQALKLEQEITPPLQQNVSHVFTDTIPEASVAAAEVSQILDEPSEEAIDAWFWAYWEVQSESFDEELRDVVQGWLQLARYRTDATLEFDEAKEVIRDSTDFKRIRRERVEYFVKQAKQAKVPLALRGDDSIKFYPKRRKIQGFELKKQIAKLNLIDDEINRFIVASWFAYLHYDYEHLDTEHMRELAKVAGLFQRLRKDRFESAVKAGTEAGLVTRTMDGYLMLSF